VEDLMLLLLMEEFSNTLVQMKVLRNMLTLLPTGKHIHHSSTIMSQVSE
jgi:hypothetical protein